MPERQHIIDPGPVRDEAAGYRPVSALAVAAIAVAGATFFTVLVIWLMARMRGRPILVPLVLVAAAGGVILSLAARWHVRRSEGIRTGLRLTRVAFWLSLLSLAGYGAYFAATDLAVRQQARREADAFLALLAEGKPELAFRLTRPPAQQPGIENDPKKIRDRFGSTDLHVFDQSDLARLCRTWAGRDQLRVEFTGPGERVDLSDGFMIQLVYSLHTPEGRFPVDVWTRRTDDLQGNLNWQILFPRTAVRPERDRTRLGRLCEEAQIECARRFLRLRWLPEFSGWKPEEVAAILRLDGDPLPDGQRQKAIDEVQRSGAINLFPGAGPMRQPGLPTLHFDPNGVRLVLFTQAAAPAVLPAGRTECAAELTVAVVGDALVKEMLKLAGPDWESQPLLSADDVSSVLAAYKSDFKVTELNLHPGWPTIAAAHPGGP